MAKDIAIVDIKKVKKNELRNMLEAWNWKYWM